jgi:hypothetical protein
VGCGGDRLILQLAGKIQGIKPLDLLNISIIIEI